MNLNMLFLTGLTFLILLFVNLTAGGQQKDAKHPQVDFSISCRECHQGVTPDIYNQWKDSKHGIMNFGCYLCHGDGQEEFWVKPTADRCIGCHPSQEVDFKELPVKNCFDCHKGHSLKFHESD